MTDQEAKIAALGSWPRVVDGIDGPTLQSLRRSKNVSLRKVARDAGMSHGHLSKVERSEVGRPVTPAVLAAYANATGVPLAKIRPGEDVGGWQLGQLSPYQRARFNSVIGGLSMGGCLNEPMRQMLDANGRLPTPGSVDGYNVKQLSLVAELLECLDGALPGLVAGMVLRWLGELLDRFDAFNEQDRAFVLTLDEETRMGLFAVVSRLARRAGTAAMELGSYGVARTNFTVSLYAAVTANDADLRALVLAEIASQYHYFGQYDDCLAVARLAQTDERVTESVRNRLEELKANASQAREQVLSAVQRSINGSDDADE